MHFHLNLLFFNNKNDELHAKMCTQNAWRSGLDNFLIYNKIKNTTIIECLKYSLKDQLKTFTDSKLQQFPSLRSPQTNGLCARAIIFLARLKFQK